MDTYNGMPYSLCAEQALLGALLIDPEVVQSIDETLGKNLTATTDADDGYLGVYRQGSVDLPGKLIHRVGNRIGV